MKRAIRSLVERAVAKYPDPFKSALLRVKPELFVQEIGRWDRQSYQNFHVNGPMKGFEDIVTLFSVGRFNRAIIRLDLDEAGLAYRIIRSIPDPVGLEIGRGWGGSTLMFAVASGERGKVHSIQLDETHDAELLRVAKAGGVADRMVLHIGDSRTIPFDLPVDWVLIDGAREYDVAKSDHLRFGKLVKKGGFILHHDMTDSRPGATFSPDLRRLQDEILMHHGKSVEIYAKAGSLLVLRKTGSDWPAF